MKFLVVALTLMMGMSMTSCLSDNESDEINGSIGRLYSNMGSYFLQTTDGYKVYPTAASINQVETSGTSLSAFVGKVLYMAYKTNDAVRDDELKTITGVSIYTFGSLENPVASVEGEVPEKPWEIEDASVDSIGNAPIKGLTDQYYGNPEFQIDNYTLYMPISYNVAHFNYTSIPYHWISLVYYPQEEMEEGTITLHLRYHTYAEGNYSLLDSYETASVFYFARYYNLRSVISRHEAEHDAVEKVVIKYYENSLSESLDITDSNVYQKEYTVNRTSSSLTPTPSI